ncbi:MAG: aminotransferase class I/II-fold pyridoxal phosphate-dependent enzyme [Polyangiaceae bacterium]|nr:aminotransferase class I/II-fold pyridoxal phosphate-dependent enzyme [Polyangiaceae bacterium]
MKFVIEQHRSRPSDDPIFALNAEARARKAEGAPVINATVGALLNDDGSLAVLPSVSEALRSVPPATAAAYAPIAGAPDFLRAVSNDVLGPHAESGACAATPGGSGALHLAISNFVEPGQTVLTSSFYWGPYKTLCDETDRQLTTFRMFNEARQFDVQSLAESLDRVLDSQGRALVILNSPCHNPTGYSLDASEWDRVANVVADCSKKGPITVLVDGAYALYGARELSHDRERILKMSAFAFVAFAWSASKSFTQYGSRVGAIVAFCPDETDRKRVSAAFSYSCRGTWSTCNTAGQTAITRALVEPDLKARVDSERAHLKELLDRRVAVWNEHASAAKLVYPRYDGGFFTTVLCDRAFDVAAALKQDHVFVVPQAGALRVALCSVAERDVPRLVAAIEKHLSRQ